MIDTTSDTIRLPQLFEVRCAVAVLVHAVDMFGELTGGQTARLGRAVGSLRRCRPIADGPLLVGIDRLFDQEADPDGCRTNAAVEQLAQLLDVNPESVDALASIWPSTTKRGIVRVQAEPSE